MATIDTSKAISKVTVEGVEVPLQGSSGEDMLQARVDLYNSCEKLFYGYPYTTMIDISRLNTDKVTNMSQMFYSCSATSLDLSTLNTSNVTNMSQMFYSCSATTIDLSSFNTSNVTDMGEMFNRTSITSLDLKHFDTSNVTDMAGMFQSNTKITTIDLSGWNLDKITSISSMFSGCSSLVSVIGTLDVNKVMAFGSTFYGCKALTTFTLKNIKKDLTIGSGTSYGTLLDDPTIINTAMELWDLTGATARKLTVATAVSSKLDTIYVKLITPSEEQITADPNITSKKPCEVCESTDNGAMTLREYIVSKNWTISG